MLAAGQIVTFEEMDADSRFLGFARNDKEFTEGKG